ncbi:MAG: N-acetylmuramoyl-L-alanine amidase [Alphaproteobacteria bacterium]|nr:N-acetylmuramoyl-L-alanine amidase [Alphaproteobacteria bacterium]MCL2504909.1 N-acetylmuramoyl-L-alanine amidase [Alphaproteobacteria bacterium]
MSKNSGKNLQNNLSRRQFVKTSACAVCFALAASAFSFKAFASTAVTAKVKPPVPKSVPFPVRKPIPPKYIVIDAGHGGKDPGAIGVKGTHEKIVTLDISKKIASILEKQDSFVVKLTRDNDTYLSLKDRVQIARSYNADLFISIHADSAPNKKASGLSIYTLSEEASDDFAKKLAETENRADVIENILGLQLENKNVSSILMDMTAKHTRNTAKQAKMSIIQSLNKKWDLFDSPAKSANFAVLRAPEIPSILIETGFLSNIKDEQILTQAAQRKKIAELLAQSVMNIPVLKV